MDCIFSPGDVVYVEKVPIKYAKKYALEGKIGTVRSVYYGRVSVCFDDLKNQSSSNGVFYFDTHHLRIIDDFNRDETMSTVDRYIQEDIEMTYTLAKWRKELERTQKEKEEIPMLKNYRVAGIRFQDGYNTDKTYPYALYDENIAIGDLVVVMTGHHGMSIAEVCSIGDFDKDAVSCDREIVCKVDMTAYQDRKARAKKLADLKKEMDAKVKALQEVALYELMAEKDPELKGMLEAFKALEQ